MKHSNPSAEVLNRVHFLLDHQGQILQFYWYRYYICVRLNHGDVAFSIKNQCYHKIITQSDDSCMVSTQCLEMNLSDLVMSALGPTALVLTSLDQTDSFSRHSADTMHSSPLWVMTSVNDDDDDDDDECQKKKVSLYWLIVKPYIAQDDTKKTSS